MAVLFSFYLACVQRALYDQQQTSGQVEMWHDDISLGFNVFILLMIVISTILIAQFHPESVRVRQLIKFEHFTEFDKEK